MELTLRMLCTSVSCRSCAPPRVEMRLKRAARGPAKAATHLLRCRASACFIVLLTGFL